MHLSCRSDHELDLFGEYTGYILSVASYLLPGLDYFDGIPLTQELFSRDGPFDPPYERMMGSAENSAYYVVSLQPCCC